MKKVNDTVIELLKYTSKSRDFSIDAIRNNVLAKYYHPEMTDIDVASILIKNVNEVITQEPRFDVRPSVIIDTVLECIKYEIFDLSNFVRVLMYNAFAHSNKGWLLSANSIEETIIENRPWRIVAIEGVNCKECNVSSKEQKMKCNYAGCPYNNDGEW